MNDLYFNNKSLWEDFGAVLIGSHELPTVTERVEEVETEGNPFGKLTIKTGMYEDLIIEREFRYPQKEGWETTKRLMNRWLTDIKDERLFFKNDTSVCVKVKNAKMVSVKKVDNVFITGTLIFLCQPFFFDTTERIQEWNNGEKLICNTDIPTLPLIELEASGNVQLTINGETLSFNHTGNVMIDSMYNVYDKDTKQIIKSIGDLPVIKEGGNTFEGVGVSTIKINTRNRYKY